MLKLLRRFYHWYIRFWYTNRLRVIMTFLFTLLILAYLWRNIFISIPSGHVGVLWSRFGQGTVNHDFGEGMHLIFPWNTMTLYDIRIQELNDSVELLTVNGLILKVDFSVRYYPIPGRVHLLHQKVGPDYLEKVVIPETISALRHVMGNYRPEEIYSRDEFGMRSEIEAYLKGEVEANYINLNDIMLTKLMLPVDLQTAIQDKLVREQQALAYQYILSREEQEKQRRILEAEGLLRFEEISKVSILKWRGIEATENLAKSPNTKIVIVGSDSQSLPVLLNTDK